MTRSLRYLLAALLLLMIGGSALAPTSRAQTPAVEVDPWSAVLDSQRAALEAKTEDALLSTYTVSADSDPRRNVFIRLHRGQCGACGYKLADLPPEADGCTTCPECAAAWKLPATARPQ